MFSVECSQAKAVWLLSSVLGLLISVFTAKYANHAKKANCSLGCGMGYSPRGNG
jgi:hypothetical protein